MIKMKLVIALVAAFAFTNTWANVLNADQGYQFPNTMPADPGLQGKNSLEGIDADGDGVRDDVQRWIYARFADVKSKRSALRQMAKAFQKAASAPLNREKSLERAVEAGKAIDCIEEEFGDQNVEMEWVRAKVLNTSARSLQYLSNDQVLSGMAIETSLLDQDSPCEGESK